MMTLLNQTRHFRLIALLASALLMWLMSATAQAQAFAQETNISVSFGAPPKEAVPVYVLAGQSVLVVFDESIGRLAVSNNDVAEAVLVAPNQMMINGKVSGRATFTAWSKDTSTFVFFNVDVRVNLAQLDSQIRALFPNMDIRLSQANGAVVISGSIPPAIMKQVEEVVKAAGYKTVNLTGQSVENIAQVQLNVKVAEISRNKLSEFAYTPAVQLVPGQGGYSNTGGGPWSLGNVDQGNIFGTVAPNLNVFFMTNNVFTFLRALQQTGAVRALAEPNLVAMDGQQASFLAGGEIPVPIVQGAGGAGGGGVTVVWKEYGVRLSFKPTILDEQHIRLEIEPEVSTLDFANAVRFQGFLIPALRVRRAKTGIELQNGQTFGVAGLLDNNESKSLSKIPVLADVPIIGHLFKSKSFQRNESELVFVVNTKIVKPWNPDQVPQMRGVDNLRNGSPLGIEGPNTVDNKGGEAPAKETVTPTETPSQEKVIPTEVPVEPVKEVKPETNGTPVENLNQSVPAKPTEPPPAEAVPPLTTPPSNEQMTKPEEKSVAPPQPGNTSPLPGTPQESSPGREKDKPVKAGMNKPARSLHALNWKLTVPMSGAVTAQARP